MLRTNDGLDAILHARAAADNRSSLSNRYSQARSIPFLILSTVYSFFRCGNPMVDSQPIIDPEKIRVVCVSDTHNHLLPRNSVPDGDIFIHAGDLTNSGTVAELAAMIDWMCSLPHPHKIFIAGNHDTGLAEPEQYDLLNMNGITYLCNQTTDLTIRDRTLRVHGSPWTPKYGNFAFQYPRDRAVQQWAGIPSGTDILVTHGPPKAHCDFNGLGCEGLLVESPTRAPDLRPYPCRQWNRATLLG